jgi:signal transduction histidine kinase
MNLPPDPHASVRSYSAWRRGLSQLSFRNKLLLTTAIVSFVCIALASLVMVANALDSYRRGLRERTLSLAELTAANLQAAVAFEDQAGANQLLRNLAADPHLIEAQVFRIDPLNRHAAATSFAAYRSAAAGPVSPATQSQDSVSDRWLPDRLEVVRPILQEQEPIGLVVLQVDLQEIDRLRNLFAWLTAALLVLTLALAWPLSRLAGRGLTRQVRALTVATNSVARSTDYSVRAAVLSNDELGKLAVAFNAMLEQVLAHDTARAYVEGEFRKLNEHLEETVRQRTDELQQRNDSLNELIARLHTAQAQLVESEKMAALGSLVAGVAHEINTPLGICITAVSLFGERLEELQLALASPVKRAAATAMLDESIEVVGIVQTNLLRAAGLVRSFKLVAVDQSGEVRRRFLLGQYVQEVLLSLGPALKNRPVEIAVDCDPSIELDSYPGALAQVITNLFINALVHAFGTGDSGRILIRARRCAQGVELEFTDSGRGMSDDVRARVFDPFFTTNRAAGGSGLGLHITYNQVRARLGGNIWCESVPGHGSTFRLRIPLQAPASLSTSIA